PITNLSEVFVHITIVHLELALPGTNAHAGNGRLAAARSPPEVLALGQFRRRGARGRRGGFGLLGRGGRFGHGRSFFNSGICSGSILNRSIRLAAAPGGGVPAPRRP